jgi:preprotein translocase subunit SecF
MQIFHNPTYNFVRWRWPALALSLVVILAGAAVIGTKGPKLGVEFEGGSIVVVKFAESLPDLERVRSSLQSLPGNVGKVLRDANLGTFEVVGREIVGPVVGEQLKRQGTWATVLALAGILIYIALRFQLSFAVGAIVATIHDLLVTIAFLAFFQYDITLNVIAALLTITGFSVNDTIVVFDRVRENMRGMRRDNLEHIVNVAVNQTLGRTVITAGTAFLSTLALYLFGGEVLHGLAFTMLVGIISGTYSTVFIAAAIAIMWQGRKPLGGQAAAAAPATPVRKPRRRVS